MKTRSFFGKKYLDLQVRELDINLHAHDVLVKVHACGVCGTDLNFLRGYDSDFMPLGHEIAGEVAECGSEVTYVKPGDMVTVEDCSMCGNCLDCKSGNPELCRELRTLNGFPGMGEYLAVDEGNLNIYTGLSAKDACLTEPLAVALGAVKKADIPRNGSVVIQGQGPIGLLIAAVAKLYGAGFVGISGWSYDTVLEKARFALAEKLGCDLLVATKTQDLVSEVRKRFPRGVDRVIVTSPPKSAEDAFKMIRFGGVISLLGLSFGGGNIISLDVNAAIFNKTTINTFFAEPAIDFPLATELIKSGKIDASLFLTHAFNFKTAREVLAANLDGSVPIIKSVFIPE